MHALQKSVLASIIVVTLVSSATVAQEMPADHEGMEARRPSIMLGASVIPLGTVADPGVGGRRLAEGYLTQPMLMAMIATPEDRLRADLTLDLEGTTLKRGELNAGVYGEGYVDRRHPHTYLHELVGSGTLGGGMSRFSVTMGKGFVPFGTDDPMSRPFVKYPVNHHLAQILERAMITAAASSGPMVLELSSFAGDEPESPSDMPNMDRFGDSWSARLTARSATGFEAQTSMAHVTSPELPQGGGLDHRKLSASIRFEQDGRYALAEWARTRETTGGATAFAFNSLLAEGSLVFGRFSLAARAERTERPEEERLLNVFRTPRPHSDLSIVGRTRWDVLSASGAVSLPLHGKVAFSPFIEVATQRPRALDTPAIFDPPEFYGASRLWSLSVGARIGVGMRHSRMGRYGVAISHSNPEHAAHDMDSHKGR